MDEIIETNSSHGLYRMTRQISCHILYASAFEEKKMRNFCSYLYRGGRGTRIIWQYFPLNRYKMQRIPEVACVGETTP